MAKYEPVLKQVLAEIVPDQKQILAEAGRVVARIQKAIDQAAYKAKAVIGGSVAKGTFLNQDHDIDIFVMFDRQYRTADLSGMLEHVLKTLFPHVVRIHGSRDYFQVKNRYSFEIVPILYIKKPVEAVNITDCSPLHVQWVKKFPKLSNEIRLTRAFCKAIGVYGAESYIQGFSGHVIDILTIWAKGFLNLLKASQKWRIPTVIDYYNKHKGRALQELNRSKIQSPLIVIDPIQPERNAAAALGKEKFQLFQEKAKQFLRKPSTEFFVRRDVTVQSLRSTAKGKLLIVLTMQSVKGKEDVIGARLKKIFGQLKQQATAQGFAVQCDWQWDKGTHVLFWFIVDKAPLSATVEHEGPPPKAKTHVRAFKAKYTKTFVRKGKIWAVKKRPYRELQHLLQDLLPQYHETITRSRMEVFK